MYAIDLQESTNGYRAEQMLKKYGATFQNERFVRGEDYTQAVMLDMEYDPDPPVNGGTPEKTKPSVYQMMLSMYDMGAQPLIDSLESR